MPRIFDNIDLQLLETLKDTLNQATRADFCVGYFNLRGWRLIDPTIEQMDGEGTCCRLLIGMQRLPKDDLRKNLAIIKDNKRIDQGEALRLRKMMAQEFREQLMLGVPSSEDEAGLKRLKIQLRSGKLVAKLHLRYTLHAKLYLVHRSDHIAPIVGFVGSSNLTLAGLRQQGELNVDVVESDAARKLQRWFDDRWGDRFCLDVSEELADIIDESWARDELIKPYYVYLKMAYHLSQEARDGLSQYQAPRSFGLLKFQEAAVQIAAHHVNKRGGVMVGDVVGLGKTLVGTAVAHLCEEDFGVSTLIICPKNLVKMWQGYVEQFGLRGKVMSISRVIQDLPDVPARFRLVLIDESHNLRNREGKRYAAIRDYIEQSGSRCILLTATPYNKTYLDLSAQLRLFVPEDKDLGIKPEILIRDLGNEVEFRRKHPQTPVRSLAAFEKSDYADDWQQLMSRYMIRRTRSFIKHTYAEQDPTDGRYFLEFPDGSRSYFPLRRPKTVPFAIGNEETDPYAKLYSDRVVDIINELHLPRYGLGNYELNRHKELPAPAEQKLLEGLSRAGRRLMGFCRTNLFKRLESSGEAFILSLERHILRNYVFIHAIDNSLEIPIGSQDAEFLDTWNSDEDADSVMSLGLDLEVQEDNEQLDDSELDQLDALEQKESSYKQRAADIYQLYQNKYARRFKWLRPALFKKTLKQHLRQDARSLIGVLQLCGQWIADSDQKFLALAQLLEKEHPENKVLIFTQFADTARYLGHALEARRIGQIAVVTGNTSDPTTSAWRFSPVSNNRRDQVPEDKELRVLVSTDVLSEGQNLQDSFIILNYDLPWAIIRLIQRAGRVDRIGQKADEILCYSFLPADGVERLINLRGRLHDRLNENAEVVGTDEAFFEDEAQRELLTNLYHEKSDILDEEDEGEVDLTSEALQIWQNAVDANPKLKGIIEGLPNVVYSSRVHEPSVFDPEGVLVYLRTSAGTDALAWVDKEGNSVTQSQMRILRTARCSIDTPGVSRHANYHELVQVGSQLIAKQEMSVVGQLGSPRSATSRAYERLTAYVREIETDFPVLATGPDWESLKRAIDEIYSFPLRQNAIAKLNREFKAGIDDEQLAKLVIFLRENDALCVINPDDEHRDAQIICSMGLVKGE
ncbi:MAG: helicase-related protein [Cyanobacteria bacterium P01_F01_bin.56]